MLFLILVSYFTPQKWWFYPKSLHNQWKNVYQVKKLYVVDEDAKTAYQAQAPWSEYEIVVMPTGIEEVETDKTAPTIVGYYDLNGKLINGKQRGAVIVRYSDGTTRKLLKWLRARIVRHTDRCNYSAQRYSLTYNGSSVRVKRLSETHMKIKSRR